MLQKQLPDSDVLPHVKHRFNAHLFPSDHERNTMPSLTVPDQSMSVQEIMRRFASGLPLMGERVPLWEDPTMDDQDLTFLPDPKHLDLAERQELEEQYNNELNAIEQKKIRYKAWKQAKEAEQAAKRAAEKKQHADGQTTQKPTKKPADEDGD